MAGVQIRIASEPDSEKISELIISLAILPWVREIPGEDVIANIRNKIESKGSSTRIFVAEANGGNLVGYGSITLVPNLLLEGKEGYKRSYYPKRGWQERAGAKNMIRNLEIRGRK